MKIEDLQYFSYKMDYFQKKVLPNLLLLCISQSTILSMLYSLSFKLLSKTVIFKVINYYEVALPKIQYYDVER